jgi:hypothetical protein
MSAKPAELDLGSTWGGDGRRQGRAAAEGAAGQNGLRLGLGSLFRSRLVSDRVMHR